MMPARWTPFHDWPWLVRRAALVLGGMVAALGQAPFDLWWAAVLALALVLVLFRSVPSPRRAFGAVWLFGVGYFGLALSWIIEPFQVDAEATGWMAPFALCLMAFGAALFWAIAGGLAARLRGGPALFALLLVGAEITRSLILTGFPWALIGHIWINTPVAQLAAWGGPHFLSLITVALALALAQAARGWGKGPLWALSGTIAIALIWGGMAPPAPQSDADAPVIRLVQPNAPQDEKWDPALRHVFFDRMLDFSAQAPRPDLIVWPESAVPQLMDYAQPAFDLMAQQAGGVPVVTGINRSNGPLYHNAFIVLDAEGSVFDLYDKAHLVPFGEYIPGEALLSALGLGTLVPFASFSPGPSPGLVDLPGIGTARALICYEGIFAEEIATDARPRLMVLITNDAWFGGGAGPRQHLAQARLRAIEQGLPMVRVANTGISAMIDAHGQITGQIDLGVAGYLDLPLPPAVSAPPYVRFGDLPVILLILGMILGLATRAGRVRD